MKGIFTSREYPGDLIYFANITPNLLAWIELGIRAADWDRAQEDKR